jgi:hypothetical protein
MSLVRAAVEPLSARSEGASLLWAWALKAFCSAVFLASAAA